MDQHPRGGPGAACEGVFIAALGDHHLLHRQVVLAGKDEIALVVGGHAHHGAGAVLGEHVIGDPDRDQLAVGRVAHTGANRHTPLGPVLGRALLVALAGHQVAKGCHGELLVGAGQGGHQGVLRRQHHVAGTKKGVGPGGEHRDRAAGRCSGPIHHRKGQFGAGGTADPVGLHGAHPLRPAVELGQVIEQGVGVGGDLEKPLAQLALLHQGTGAPGAAVAIHLLIGEHGLVDGIPVDGGVLLVGQAGVEKLQEQPLGPAVVVGVAGRQFPAPVNRQAQLAELLAHRGDVLVGPGPWIDAPLNRCIFGGEAEGIPAHRVQHPLAPQPLHPGNHIGDHVIAHMAHVQVPRWIGKHRQGVETLLARGGLGRVVQAEAVPLLLPTGFDRLGLVAAAIAHCRHGHKPVMVPQPAGKPRA